MDAKEILDYDEKIAILKARENKVVKHNDLVQKSRFNLSAVELKTINFLISLIKPQKNIVDVQPLEYEFEIQTYCKICGIDYSNGTNYKTVRDTLRELCRKDAIVTLPDGTDTRVTWINKFWSNKGTGKAKIRFDEDMAKYIMNVLGNTTRFELLNVLPMKSKYSIRMYEICRSWARLGSRTYQIEELRKMLMIPENELVNFKDFRRRVLEISQREINEHTDLNIYFEPVKKGIKVVQIRIHIKEKPQTEKIKTQFEVNKILDKEKNNG